MKNRKAGKKEFKMMGNLKHENVVPLISNKLFDFDRNEFFGIFMPYYPRGDLEDFLNQKNSERRNWTENDALKFSSQLIYGLSYLHENQIVHRDIKPKNIFITENDQLKIGDFDVSGKLFIFDFLARISGDKFLCRKLNQKISRQPERQRRSGRNSTCLLSRWTPMKKKI